MANTRKKSKSKSKRKSLINASVSIAKKSTKRVKSAWNDFVKKIYSREKKNGKTFGQCMKIASKEWPNRK